MARGHVQLVKLDFHHDAFSRDFLQGSELHGLMDDLAEALRSELTSDADLSQHTWEARAEHDNIMGDRYRAIAETKDDPATAVRNLMEDGKGQRIVAAAARRKLS